jgi:hypothetical protein
VTAAVADGGLFVPGGPSRWVWRTLEPDGYGAHYVVDYDDEPMVLQMAAEALAVVQMLDNKTAMVSGLGPEPVAYTMEG